MAFVQLLATLVVVGILYTRMVRRADPAISRRAQVIVPVVFGVLSLLLSLCFTALVSLCLRQLGVTTLDIANPVLSAFASALVGAGLTEELAKFAFLLIACAIFKPRNVYEHMVAGAGIGFGFTLLEEFAYGTGLSSLTRIPLVAMHVVFGIIMARHLGTARHNLLRGNAGVRSEVALALVVPILTHTAFDACTMANPALASFDTIDENGQVIGLRIALVAVIVTFVWQVVSLVSMRRKADAYCAMETV